MLKRRPVAEHLFHAQHARNVRPRLNPLFEQVGDEVPTGGILSSVRMRARMPGRRRFKRKRSRRYGRRRNYRRRPGVPHKVVRVCKSTVYIPADPGAGTIAVGQLFLNSAHDPTGDTGTGQPLTHDQYSGLYERCAVIGGKVFMEAVSADGTVPVAVGICPLTSGTNLTTYEHYRELPGGVFRVMTPDQDKVTCGFTFGVKRHFAHRKLLTDDRLSANIGVNPEDILYAHVYAQALDKAANPGIVHMVVTITQWIVYYKPKVVARS